MGPLLIFGGAIVALAGGTAIYESTKKPAVTAAKPLAVSPTPLGTITPRVIPVTVANLASLPPGQLINISGATTLTIDTSLNVTVQLPDNAQWGSPVGNVLDGTTKQPVLAIVGVTYPSSDMLSFPASAIVGKFVQMSWTLGGVTKTNTFSVQPLKTITLQLVKT